MWPGFEKPSTEVIPFCKVFDVIQQAQSGTGKTATFCSGVLQQLHYLVPSSCSGSHQGTRSADWKGYESSWWLPWYQSPRLCWWNKCALGSTYPPVWCPCCCWYTWSCFDMLRRQSLPASSFQVSGWCFLCDDATWSPWDHKEAHVQNREDSG